VTACVVGSGAREHALAVALARSEDVVVAPGNPGTEGRSEQGHRITRSDLSPTSIAADLFVIGPERPLVDGLADELREERYRAAPLLRRRVAAGQLGRQTGSGFFSYQE